MVSLVEVGKASTGVSCPWLVDNLFNKQVKLLKQTIDIDVNRIVIDVIFYIQQEQIWHNADSFTDPS